MLLLSVALVGVKEPLQAWPAGRSLSHWRDDLEGFHGTLALLFVSHIGPGLTGFVPLVFWCFALL